MPLNKLYAEINIDSSRAEIFIITGVINTIVAKTTIAVKEETRDRLAEHGSKGDTWDDVVSKVLNELETTDD